MGQQLPDTSQLTVLHEWHIGMPYLPLLGQEWIQDYPWVNSTNGWYLWCDLDTKATYIMVEHCDDESEYEYCEQYEEQYYNQGKYMDDENDPAYPLTHWQVAYMWDKEGNGYALGNKYHNYGWWVINDNAYMDLLWDLNSDQTMRW